MTWGTENNTGGGAWETAPDASWPTAEPTAPAAVAAETTADTADTGNNGGPETTDNAAPAGDSSEAPAGELATKAWNTHEKTTYNYEEYDTRDGEYDGNARVYHWDGEEGDIGPEFPELEIEIFGPPEQRGQELFGPEIAR